MGIGEVRSNRIQRRLGLLMADLVDRNPDYWMQQLEDLLDDERYRSNSAEKWRALAEAGHEAVVAVLTAPHPGCQPLVTDCPFFLDAPIDQWVRLEIISESSTTVDPWTATHRVLTEAETVLGICEQFGADHAEIGRNMDAGAPGWGRPDLIVDLPEGADLLTLVQMEEALEDVLDIRVGVIPRQSFDEGWMPHFETLPLEDAARDAALEAHYEEQPDDRLSRAKVAHAYALQQQLPVTREDVEAAAVALAEVTDDVRIIVGHALAARDQAGGS